MIPLPNDVTIAEMTRRPELWAADPLKSRRRLAKWRKMPAFKRVRAMELMVLLMEAGRITRVK